MCACRGLQSGTVWVNTWNQFDAAVPFGGYKLSGIGREHGEEVLNHYTQVQHPSFSFPLPPSHPYLLPPLRSALLFPLLPVLQCLMSIIGSVAIKQCSHEYKGLDCHIAYR